MNSSHFNPFSIPDITEEQFIEIFSRKCRQHPTEISEFIHLNPSSKHHRICYLCMQEKNIPHMDVLQLRQLLGATSASYLLSFPVLTDPSITKRIKGMIGSVDVILSKMDEFFDELKHSIDESIEKAKIVQKKKFIELTSAYQKTLDSFNKCFTIDELKGIVLKSKGDQEEKLKLFIKNHCDCSFNNTKLIKQNLHAFNKIKQLFSLEKPMEIQINVAEQLASLDFFFDQFEGISQIRDGYLFQEGSSVSYGSDGYSEISVPSQVQFLPSKINYEPFQPEQMIISREKDGSIFIQNQKLNNGEGVQCYLNEELKQNQRYILRVELSHAQERSLIDPKFQIGLIHEAHKEKYYISTSSPFYDESQSNDFSKIIKGSKVNSDISSNKFKNGKQLEFRIHLAEKYMAVASYPDYENVAQLEDERKIKQKTKQYLGMYICYYGDSIRVLEFKKVAKFNDKMSEGQQLLNKKVSNNGWRIN